MDANHPKFWYEIAKQVRSKTAEQCQKKWFAQFKSPAVAKRKGAITMPNRNTVAGVKTKMFKKQLRSYMQQSENTHKDDLLHFTTPGKAPMQLGSNLDDIPSPKSLHKKKKIILDQYSDSSSDDDKSKSSSPGILTSISNHQRNELDSYVSDFQKKKPNSVPALQHSRLKLANKQKMQRTGLNLIEDTGSRLVSATMTPGGTTKVSVNKKIDHSDSESTDYKSYNDSESEDF